METYHRCMDYVRRFNRWLRSLTRTKDVVPIIAPYMVLPVLVATWTGVEDGYEYVEDTTTPLVRGLIIVVGNMLLGLLVLKAQSPYSGRSDSLGGARRSEGEDFLSLPKQRQLYWNAAIVGAAQEYIVIQVWTAWWFPIEALFNWLVGLVANHPLWVVICKIVLSHLCLFPLIVVRYILLCSNQDVY